MAHTDSYLNLTGKATVAVFRLSKCVWWQYRGALGGVGVGDYRNVIVSGMGIYTPGPIGMRSQNDTEERKGHRTRTRTRF